MQPDTMPSCRDSAVPHSGGCLWDHWEKARQSLKNIYIPESFKYNAFLLVIGSFLMKFGSRRTILKYVCKQESIK